MSASDLCSRRCRHIGTTANPSRGASRIPQARKHATHQDDKLRPRAKGSLGAGRGGGAHSVDSVYSAEMVDGTLPVKLLLSRNLHRCPPSRAASQDSALTGRGVQMSQHRECSDASWKRSGKASLRQSPNHTAATIPKPDARRRVTTQLQSRARGLAHAHACAHEMHFEAIEACFRRGVQARKPGECRDG